LEYELSQDALLEEEEEKENEKVKQENGIEEKSEMEVIPSEPKEKTLIERIYEENRVSTSFRYQGCLKNIRRISVQLPFVFLHK
jgi:hypothetical protein